MARPKIGDNVKNAEQQQQREHRERSDLCLPSHTSLVLLGDEEMFVGRALGECQACQDVSRAMGRGPHEVRERAKRLLNRERDRGRYKLLHYRVHRFLDLIDRPVGDDGTFEEHRDVVGHHEDRLEVVRDHDRRAVELLAQT